MHHQPDRRLVDSHAEGAGGDHQIEAVVQEGVEDGGAPGPVEAGVVGRGPVARRRHRPGDRLGEPAGGRVDDGHPVVASEEPQQRVQALAPAHGHDPEPEIGAIEGREMDGHPLRREAQARVISVRTPGVALPVRATTGGRPSR